ncbi:hypothetical protein NP511_14350 [Natrinema thermotolerans]|uniref:DUF7311 domain-containing protein n=1 Tax=Natrinema thermotolerans TaxID=121872 RepID=A0AAF0P756_9EURY|nr:hypothetical protein [Natrinema thermotolerans]QCC59585.1 hypothetical protein DVR14_13490 [Natrinema thermotolerans]WMT06563.1 hypothetical protein NP511_14350 [Natrinema thermotolerans]
MNRYVVAAVLTVALAALAAPAIERGATMNTHRQVETGIASVDDAATDLVATEEPSPDGHPNPRRVVELTLPRRSLTTVAVDHVRIVPRADRRATVVRYALADGRVRETIIDERIVGGDPDDTEPFVVRERGENRLALTLRTDADGKPVVVASRL